MTGMLFEFAADAVAAHDPGGKLKIALPRGVSGDAMFSACGKYRQRLRRWIGPVFPNRFIVFIGMNPSTAEAQFNDRTLARGLGYMLREGYRGMSMVNSGDMRATYPADLLAPGVVAASPANLPVVLDEARRADKVVVCFGKVNRALAPAVGEMLQALRAESIKLWCFGTNGDGSPKHPLYLAKTAPLVRFS